MRKNKTYKNKPTKYREKESVTLKAIFICLVLGAGAINALICGFSSKTDKVSSLAEKAQIQAPMASQDTPSDRLSTGERVIYTKTPYFDNEVQVWLAAEAAAKSVGQGDKLREDLIAMAWTESRTFNYKALGDGSKSYGAWQIHLGYHPEITVEQATDPYWAAKWTAKRLIAKGWVKDREYAVRSHNGNPTQPQTIPYWKTVNKYLEM